MKMSLIFGKKIDVPAEKLVTMTPEQIMDHGVSRSAALRFCETVSLYENAMLNRSKSHDRLMSSQQMFEYILPHTVGQKDEKLWAIMLNMKLEPLGVVELGHGTVGEVVLAKREMFRQVLEHNASRLVFVHNHPSGSHDPSEQDISLTGIVETALKYVDCELVDHIICAGGTYFSFADAGMI